MTEFPVHEDVVVVSHEKTEKNYGPLFGQFAYLATHNVGRRKTPLVWVSTGGVFVALVSENERSLRVYKYGTDPARHLRVSSAFEGTALRFAGYLPLKDGWYLPGTAGTVPYSWRFPTPWSLSFTESDLTGTGVDHANTFLDLVFTTENRRLFLSTLASAASPGGGAGSCTATVVVGEYFDALVGLEGATKRVMQCSYYATGRMSPKKMLADALKGVCVRRDREAPRFEIPCFYNTLLMGTADANKFPPELDTNGRSVLMFALKKPGSRVKRFPRGWTVIEQTDAGSREYCENVYGRSGTPRATLAVQLLKIVAREMERGA